MRGIRVLAVLACVATATALAGCAGPATHHQSGKHSHVATGPRPTPTPTEAAAPPVRVPVACTSILDNARAAALIGKPVVYSRDASTLPKDIRSIAERQYGSLDCLWAGPDVTDGAFVESVGVTITPDASAAYQHSVPEIEKEAGEEVTLRNVAGDQSEISCTNDLGVFCDSNMLVGQFWTDVTLFAPGTTSTATAGTQLKSVLVTIAGLLRSAQAAPAWNPPGTLPDFCDDSHSNASTAAMNTALASRAYAWDPGETVAPTAATWEQYTSQFASCGFTSTTGSLRVSLLQGGAWAMPLLLADTKKDALGRGPFTTLDIPGVGTAAYDCTGQSGGCQALVADGSNLVGFDLPYAPASKLNPELVKVVTAVTGG